MNNKTYYIIAMLDDKGTEEILRLQKELGLEINKSNNLPHFTLSVYDKEMGSENLLEWANEFAKTQKSIEFRLSTPAIFCGGLVIAPNMTKDIYEMYYNIHQKYEEYSIEERKFTSNLWFAHVTLTYNSEHIFNKKISVLANTINVIDTKLVSIRVTCRENGKFTCLGEFPLQAGG